VGERLCAARPFYDDDVRVRDESTTQAGDPAMGLSWWALSSMR
jgi:hypothetical protein